MGSAYSARLSDALAARLIRFQLVRLTVKPGTRRVVPRLPARRAAQGHR